MAKFENMTLSYTQIASIPFKTRKTASVSLLDALSRELTPGQRVALFPSYVNKIYASGGVSDGKSVSPPPEGDGEVAYVPATVEKVGHPKPSKGLATTKEVIPVGLIPDPVTGKPTRVPDQQKMASLKDVGDGQDLPINTRMAIVQKTIEEQLKRDGYKAKDIKAVAAAFTGQVMAESGFNPNALHDKDTSGKPTGYGIYGARLNRRDSMLAWLSDNGYEKNSLVGQAKFMAHEALTDPEYSKLMEDLSEMTDIGEMTLEVGKRFEKPQNIYDSLETRINAAKDASTLDLTGFDEEGEFSRLETVFDLPEEATAEPIKIAGKTTIDGIDATILDYGGEDKNGLGGVPILKAGGMEGSYDNNSAKKSAKPYGGVVFHVTGKQTVAEQLQFQKDSGYGYQYIIDKEGNIIEAADPLKDRPNQIKGPSSEQRHGRLDLSNQNALSIGFITGGGKPTQKQLEAIKKGLPQIYKKLDIPTTMPDGTPNYPVGHGEIQYDRGPDSGLGPKGTAEGYVMAEPLRNPEYWGQLTNYGDEYKPATEDTAVPVVTAPEGPILSSDNVHQPEGSTVDNKRQDRLMTELPPEPTYTPEPKKQTLQDITGLPTKTPPGYNAAAGGAEITDPSMIISEDGKKVTRVAETGPEQISVMPRHKSSDVFQENQIMIQQMIEQTSKEEMRKPDIADMKSTPRSSDFGLPREGGQSIQISTVMPKISPSTGKAFADAKMVGRFNKADVEGDMGIVHIDRGYA